MDPIQCSYWEKLDQPPVPTAFDEDGKPYVWSPIYYNLATGERSNSAELPLGAILDHAALSAYGQHRAGPDGLYLVCLVPGREGQSHFWNIDGRAANCTRPDDDVHRCWVRHGEPPNLTVDKDGDTCDAGGGSIQTDGWHGFLRDGQLVDA